MTSAHVIGPDDPRRADVRALPERHLRFARATSPPEDAHARDVDGLTGPAYRASPNSTYMTLALRTHPGLKP